MIRGIFIILITLYFGYRLAPPSALSISSSCERSVDTIFQRLRRPSQTLAKSKGNISAILTFLLIISGDIETNPGPRSIYPCGICEQEVTWQCKGICCDSCNIWFHNTCCNINSYEYLLLNRSNTQWKCPRCDSINVDSFTFNSFELSCYNSFSPLASDDARSSIDSLSSNPFSPKHTSSPQQKSRRNSSLNSENTRHRYSRSRRSQKSTSSTQANDSSVFHLPKKTNLRTINVNCQSISGKTGEFQAALQYIKPDIVFGTESWLRGYKPGKTPSSDAIRSSEVFPPNYNIFRNDRNIFGGGVFIMVHDSLIVEEQPEFVTNCEIAWVRIKLQGRKDLYAGSFYMPHRNLPDTEELKKSLDKLSSDGSKDRDILLAGDFNCPGIDWEHHAVRSSADDVKVQQAIADITSNSLLTQIHHEPTRLTNTLDLIFTSNPTLVKSSKSVPGISDHNIVVSDFDIKPHKSKEQQRKVYKFNKANWDRINDNIEILSKDINDHYINGTCVEDLWEKFKSSLLTIVNEHVPSKTAKKHSKLPWINKNIHKLLKRKKKLYDQAKKSRNWASYSKFQKYCKKEIRRAEWSYLNQKILNSLQENNAKPFWNYVKSKRKDNTGVAPLKRDGILVNEPIGKSEILLNQFKSVFTKDDDKPLPQLSTQAPPIDQIKVTDIGVEKLLKDLKPHKAAGPDAIPNILLKTCSKTLATPLSQIFQKSLDSGRLPQDWLSANISSAFKKGDRHLAENYRPISLTSVSCKLLEHIICKHVINHLETNSILTNLNHGFRSGYSCESQLITTVHDFLTSFDKKRQVDIAILDFSKAFDTVPHRKLLHKLESYGINGPILKWLKCFLTERSMKVVLEGASSCVTSVDSGVPQGTVLGPLLFLCHINDLPNAVTSQVRLFADDCLLYREINSFADHTKLQNDLNNLQLWAENWGMRFNASKCYILSLQSKSNFFYNLCNTILKTVPTNPYLGILLSEDMKWSAHIDKISKKANTTLGFLRRNLFRCPHACKKNAYISLIRSVLEYGAVLWDPYMKKDIDKLERIQRAAARFITGDYQSRTPGSVDNLLKRLHLPALQSRRKCLRLVLFYKVVEGLVPALPHQQFLTPQKPKRRIKSAIDSSSYIANNTVDSFIRNNNKCFTVQLEKTDQFKNSFFVKTTIDWNRLDDRLVNLKTINSFRSAISKELACHQ